MSDIEINSISNEGIGIGEVIVNHFEVNVTTLHECGTAQSSYNVSVTDKYGNSLNPKEQRWGETSTETIFNKNNLKGDELKINIYSNSSKDELLLEKEVNIK